MVSSQSMAHRVSKWSFKLESDDKVHRSGTMQVKHVIHHSRGCLITKVRVGEQSPGMLVIRKFKHDQEEILKI